MIQEIGHKRKKAFKIARWIVGFIAIIISILLLLDAHYSKDVLEYFLILAIGLLILPPSLIFIGKFKWVAILIILLLLIFNPSPSEFKNYSQELGDRDISIYQRKANYLIFSVYLKRWGTPVEDQQLYIGLLGNFFEWD